MSIKPKKITHKELCKQLEYNTLTGIIKWKISKQGMKKGDIAGHKDDSSGYIRIMINNKLYAAHVLAWFHYYGYFPENDIDHKDRIKYHNWISNLREVTKICNARNRGNPKNNTSGVKGVYWNKDRNKWMGNITINQKLHNLGTYKDFDNAVCARLAGEQCVDWSGCDSSSPAFKYVQQFIIKKENYHVRKSL